MLYFYKHFLCSLLHHYITSQLIIYTVHGHCMISQLPGEINQVYTSKVASHQCASSVSNILTVQAITACYLFLVAV